MFINDLRKNLSDKDELYEVIIIKISDQVFFINYFFIKLKLFVKNHFDLLKQKDDLIINLRSSQKQLHCDLNKANEILLESENSVEILKNELHQLQQKNKHLVSSLDLETKKNRVRLKDRSLIYFLN